MSCLWTNLKKKLYAPGSFMLRQHLLNKRTDRLIGTHTRTQTDRQVKDSQRLQNQKQDRRK